MPHVLENIRVVDLTQALAGPFCTMMLGDMGADVIKIERPGSGDQSRGWGPPFVNGESTYFLSVNRNKRSFSLDVRTQAGRELIQRLVKTSDVFVCNIPRHASRKRAGIDAETLQALNPRLVYCLISGYGLDGPYAERPGYDLLAQGEAGLMSLTGDPAPEAEPYRFPVPMADITTGMYAGLGILGALYARTRNGRGQVIDVSLFESQTAWLSMLASAYLNADVNATRMGNLHPNIVPYQVFQAQDKHLIVTVGTEKLWHTFCEAMDLVYLRDDPRFATNRERIANREALTAILAERFGTLPAGVWLERLQAVNIPCGPINRVPETLDHPQHRARNFLVEQEHPLAGLVRSLGNPVRYSDTVVEYRLPPPMLGQHTAEILTELAVSTAEIERLQGDGVV
jgi:crotonobetainyl-CoA:carnitine CoA-transferase CaiB-like acyl-CoA transferase